jgi:Skp family chaperone for outer membrane proteins
MIHAAVAVLMFAAGCTPAYAADEFTHETYYKESLAGIKELAAILKTVVDKKTAEQAKPQLEKAAKSLEEIGEKGKKLAPPSEELKKELRQKYEKDLEQAVRELLNEINNLYGKKDVDVVIDWFHQWRARKPM